MRRLIFDLDILRGFVTGIELGSFSKAADRLGRSTSAISAQLKKLEEEIGAPVLKKAGRKLILTTAGETLLGYARRLLELNDEAAGAVRGVDLEGSVRIGLQEDFGESLLARVLGDFARTHPRVRVEAHVVRNAELLQLVSQGRLDLALAWKTEKSPLPGETLDDIPMCWIESATGKTPDVPQGQPLPLVMFEAPCMMRRAATTALDTAGMPWRIAFTSVSLSGVWAAVSAGLGVTVRTRVGLPDYLRVRDDLPELPSLTLVLHHAQKKRSETVQRLSEIIQDAVTGQLPATVR